VLAVGDISGDGTPDLVLGSQRSSGAGLVWYEAPAWTRHEVASGEFTTDGAVADLNGDGMQDIVIGDERIGLRLFENPGGGRSWNERVLGGGYVHDVVAGDVDGDGRGDIVTCSKSEVVLWAATEGGWTRRVLLSRPGEGIALADVDRDDDLDVVFGGSWVENAGTSEPWPLWPIGRPRERCVVRGR
jgi:hypothetical protein